MDRLNHRSEKTRSRGRRWAVEFVSGLVGSLLGAVLGVVVGALIGGNLSGVNGSVAFAGMRGYEATGWLGLIIGVIVGGSSGVYWAGRFHRFAGPYLETLLGSVLAVLVGALLLMATGQVAREDWLFNQHPLALPILFLGTLLGGMLGFEFTGYDIEPDG